jgi:hypothetical protein
VNSLVALYPNPTDQDVTVSLNPGVPVQSSIVSVFNSLGILLETKEMGYSDNMWKTNINAAEYSKGTYFIRIEYGRKSIRKSFIKI